MAIKKCTYCNGTGVCDMCDGKRTIVSQYGRKIEYYEYGEKRGQPKKCNHCKQTGRCSYCNGNGYVSTSSNSGSSSNSSSSSTSDYISWWEFGHTDEFLLKSLFLLPFRLIAYAIMIPLSIGFWAIRFVYRIIASIFVILVSIIILMPIKIIIFIISFGHWNWFEERFIERLEYIWD